MNTLAEIQYRDYWDVPRQVVVSCFGKIFFLECPFSDDAEDYHDTFAVYEITAPSPEQLGGNWQELKHKARLCGNVPVSELKFGKAEGRRTLELPGFRQALSRFCGEASVDPA